MHASKFLHVSHQEDGKVLLITCKGNAHVHVIGSTYQLSIDRRHHWVRHFKVRPRDDRPGLIALVIELISDNDRLTFEFFLRFRQRQDKMFLVLDEDFEALWEETNIAAMINEEGFLNIHSSRREYTNDPTLIHHATFERWGEDHTLFISGDTICEFLAGILTEDRLESIARNASRPLIEAERREQKNIELHMEIMELEHKLEQRMSESVDFISQSLHQLADNAKLTSRITELEEQRDNLLQKLDEKETEIRRLRGEPDSPTT